MKLLLLSLFFSLSVSAQTHVVLIVQCAKGDVKQAVEWQGAIPHVEDYIEPDGFLSKTVLTGKQGTEIYQKSWSVARINWIRVKGKTIAQIFLTGEM